MLHAIRSYRTIIVNGLIYFPWKFSRGMFFRGTKYTIHIRKLLPYFTIHWPGFLLPGMN